MINRVQLLVLLVVGCGHHDSSSTNRQPEDSPKTQALRVSAPMDAPTRCSFERSSRGEPPASMITRTASSRRVISDRWPRIRRVRRAARLDRSACEALRPRGSHDRDQRAERSSRLSRT